MEKKQRKRWAGRRLLAGIMAGILLCSNLGLESYALETDSNLTEVVSVNTLSALENVSDNRSSGEEVVETSKEEKTALQEEGRVLQEEKPDLHKAETLIQTEGRELSATTEEIPEAEAQGIPAVGEAEITLSIDARIFQEGDLSVIEEEEQVIPGHSLMAEEEKEVRYARAREYFYQELLKEPESIDLRQFKIHADDFNMFFNTVINDHPDLYRFNPYGCKYSISGADNCVTRVINLSYYEDRAPALFDRAVEDALLVIKPGMTDLEKAIALHDYIILNTEYDYDDYLAGTIPKVSYSAYGVLVDGVAVCNGYALAYKYLCELQGIECLMVISDGMNHAWNLIKLGEHYYHVDATWDDPTWDLLGRVRHFYMFISDAEFINSREHYGWYVVKNGAQAELTATDTTYDTYYWSDVNSHMIYGEEDYYCVDATNRKLKKISRSTGQSADLVSLGRWKYWEREGASWTKAFSNVFESNGRIYYNESNAIYSIDPENPTDIRLEYSNPYSTTGEIYGMALQKGVVKYMLGQDPNNIQNFTTHVARFQEEITQPVEKVVLAQKEAELNINEQLTLSYTSYPTHVTPVQISWESDNRAVATVDNGVVTAVGEGSCNITITVDGISDSCKITVLGATRRPQFSVPEGTIDKGESVTITAEENADIYYSLNGADPVTAGQLYQGPIVINEDVTINAYAIVEGREKSQVVSVSYIACENQLVFSQTSVTVRQEEWEVLSFSKIPTTKTIADITITSNAPDVAVVENGYLVYGVGKGQAILTAAVADHKGRTVTAQIPVTVNPITYTVKFWNDGQLLSEEQVEKGEGAVPPAAPDISGYTFTGWNKSYENVQANMDIYAQYTPTNYQINYQLGAGSNALANPSDYTIESDTITLQDAVAPEGYQFAGWYKESTYSTQVSTIGKGSTGNLTLYARYEPVSYRISYELNGGTSKGNNPDTYTIETSTITLKAASGNPGAIFEGWYEESRLVNKITRISRGNVGNLTLYAGWQLEAPSFGNTGDYMAIGGKLTIIAPKSEAVIYYTLDGTTPDTSKTRYSGPITISEDMVMGEEITIKAIAVAENYKSSAVAEKTYIPYEAEIMLDKTEVIFSRDDQERLQVIKLPEGKTENDVQWVSKNEKIVTVENGLLIPVAAGNTVVEASVIDHAGNRITAECQVTILPLYYKVTFLDKEGNTIQEGLVEEGTQARAPIAEEIPGYRFVGWNQQLTNIQSKLLVSPIYELMKYQLQYFMNEETVTSLNPAEYTIEDEEIILQPLGLREGIIFIGWYDNPLFAGEKITTIPKGSRGNKNFYALTEYQQYTISYGHGTNPGDNPTVYTIKDSIILKEPEKKEGYIFVGWYDNEDLKGSPIERLENRTGDLTLYAKWRDERGLWMEEIEPIAYTGKKVQPSEIKVYDGGTLLLPGTDYTVTYKNNINVNDLSPEKLSKAPTITIKGKGNYTGVITKTFEIVSKNLTDSDVVIDDLALAYKANKKQFPVPKVSWNGKNLIRNKDFVVTYVDSQYSEYFKEPGEYQIKVKGINNYSGEKIIKLHITSQEEILMSKVKIKKIPNREYTGEAVEVDSLLELTYNNMPLVIGEDYQLIYQPCIEIGTHTIKIEGINEYKGTLYTSFKITGRAMSKVRVDGLQNSVVYTGRELTLGDGFTDLISLTYSSKETGNIKLEAEDYEVSYKANVNKGTAQILFTGKNSYSGVLKKTVKITAYDLAIDPERKIDAWIIDDVVYHDKGGARPKVEVVFDGITLEENKDYRLTYKNNKVKTMFASGNASVVITGIGNFKGKTERSFTIEEQRLEELAVYAPDVEVAGPGKYKSKIKVTDKSGKALTEGKDYFVMYCDEEGSELAKNAQPAVGDVVTVKIFGKGNYAGMVISEYKILEKGRDIAKAKITLEKGRKWYYTGREVTLEKEEFTVKIKNETLSRDAYEIISYSNNVLKGTAKVVIEGRNGYSGRKEFTFKIGSQTMKWWDKLF